jgi:hypothetical protein
MKKLSIIPLTLLMIPGVTHAQSIQNFFTNIVGFLSNTVIPFLLGLGFLFFVINVVRYFVIGGSNEEGREKAKALILYSILAFVIIVIFWGIIAMLADSLGLEGETQPNQDYVKLKGG